MKEISFNPVERVREFFLSDKKRALAILAAIGGILLVFLSLGSGENNGDESAVGFSEYELEENVSEFLSSIDGVGKCEVKISFSSGERLEYKNGSLVYREPARVSGVSVVCEGGDDSSVVSSVVDALSALFDIGMNRISVQKMK